VNGIQVPSGIVFDPINLVFVVTNSLQNDIIMVDPVTCIPTVVRVGINPTSIDYDFQTSTLVTVNSASNTMSVLDYVCPPAAQTSCPTPQTQTILGLPSSAQFSQSQQFSVAIDAKLNLAVVVDTNNSRVLLIPLPH
jgi:DNA-binding beta-propeller fold protein YncE